MPNIFKIKNNCRLCESRDLMKIVEIGKSPVSEKYSDTYDQKPEDTTVPLDLYFCKECFHVQLIHVVDPDFLWDKFTFKTSRNIKLSNHYENYVKTLINFATKTKNNFVVDVGSNDGTLLKIFKNKGIKKILGVDPAKKIAEEANKNGVKTIPNYMNLNTSNEIKKNWGLADFVTANNVYAHIDDMNEVTDAIKNILDKNGIFSFEVSYLLDVLKKKLLGTIFHEHLSYHSLYPLIKFFKKKGLEIVDVTRNNLQGGSLVCFAQHRGGPYKISSNVTNLLKLEKESNLDNISSFKNFSKSLSDLKDNLNNTLDKILENKKTIAAFGSARSATTLIKYFDIASKINFIVDDNQEKHFKFTPGDRIRVYPSQEIYKKKIDYLVIFAWEHAEKIIKKHQNFIKEGGTFINIIPKLELIN